jgi:hypothetical protein
MATPRRGGEGALNRFSTHNFKDMVYASSIRTSSDLINLAETGESND